MSQNLLTVAEVSEVLRVPLGRGYQLARQGVLPGTVRLGRQIRVRADMLQQFIEAGGQALPGGWRRQPKLQGENSAGNSIFRDGERLADG